MDEFEFVEAAGVPERLQDLDLAEGRITQIAAWMHQNISGADEEDLSFGQWLHAGKTTMPGERQVVWEAGAGPEGRGIVALVDFSGPVAKSGGQFYCWGVIHHLEPPVGADRLSQDPVMAERFAGSGKPVLQGRPKYLRPDEHDALMALIGEVPEFVPSVSSDYEFGAWTGTSDVVAEEIIELHAWQTKRLWSTLGFASKPQRQRRLSAGVDGAHRLDLSGPAKGGGSLVVEIKREIGPTNGPQQVATYRDRLEREFPEEGPWRAGLLHAAPTLSAAAAEAIRRHGVKVDVFRMYDGSFGRVKVECEERFR